MAVGAFEEYKSGNNYIVLIQQIPATLNLSVTDFNNFIHCTF